MTTPTGPDATMSKSARHRLRALKWALGIASACALLLTAWFVIESRTTDRALNGVHVGAVDVSGLERSQIEARMQAWAAQRASQKTVLSLRGRSLEFEPKSVGFAVDAAAIAKQALEEGHSGGFFARFAGFIARRLRAHVLAIDVRFDAGQLSALFDEWERTEIKDPPFSGGIAVTGSDVAPLYAHAGSRLDRPRVVAQLRSALASDTAPLPLATHTESTGVERAEVDRIVTQAQSMIAGDTELASTDGTRRLVLNPLQMGSLLRVTQAEDHGKLELGCSAEALKAVLEPQRAALEQQPKNATFVIDAKDRISVTPSQSGSILDDRAVASALCAAAASPTRKAELPLAPGAEPALSTEAAEHAGVAGLVGTYTTRHACCQPRVQNIHHIADLLDGTLVRPGETFSVNQTIGPRTVKNGFRPAPSIEDGDMVDTVGGGVSQFATTLFNALFYGGYDILERQPHSYWFTRYPMGYDATLSYPHPDIVFKNDTDAAALIKTQYTDTTITVKIYGDNGGRRVRAEVSPRQNIVPPPVEFIPNRELDADEEKNREGGMVGWTVVVKRTLTFPDGKIKEERRKVTYKPRARRVEVHPCRIPEGEPGHTGERCPKPKNDADDAAASGAADAGAK